MKLNKSNKRQQLLRNKTSVRKKESNRTEGLKAL